MRKNQNKKGFTLVEIIIVLVILAILAAMLIPSMVGWIDKAEEKSAAVAGRSILLAAQTIASENYALDDDGKAAAVTLAEVNELVRLDPAVTSISNVDVTDSQVTAFTAVWDGYTITYDGATMNVGTVTP